MNSLLAVPTIEPPFSNWRVVLLDCGHTDALGAVAIQHRLLIGMEFPCHTCCNWMPITDVIEWKP
jgi:hypothetical protein